MQYAVLYRTGEGESKWVKITYDSMHLYMQIKDKMQSEVDIRREIIHWLFSQGFNVIEINRVDSNKPID